MLPTEWILLGRDVGILQFCACRILCKIGQRMQNCLSCAELTKWHRNCKILQIILNSVALSSVLMAAIARAKHFVVKVIKQNNAKK